jgi:tripartite-type tricarboxylate transporter receptor subunit TctC
MRRASVIAAAAACLALHANGVQAQTKTVYPDPARQIRIVVPLAPGGNLDIVARTLAQGLGERLGQPVIVENRPGASSLVGTQSVARAPPDGYTLLAIANTFTSVPAIVASPGYDPLRDFVAVSLTCRIPQVLSVNPSVPVQSVQELIALAKSKPGTVSYGTSGNGSTAHIAAELFSRQAGGIKLLHVPYKGNAQAMTDLLAGQVMMMFDQVSTSAPHIRAGKLRPLGVTTLTRSAVLPDVPTISESGLPGFEDVTFNGIIAPAGTPREAIERLHAEIAAVLKGEELRKRFLERGIELQPSRSADEFAVYLKAEVEKYAKLVREAGIKAE